MDGGRLVYESLDPITAEEAESVFRTGQPREISRALLRLSLHGPDWDLAEQRALEFLSHPDVWVCRNAATSLAHISRLARKLDVDVVVPALLALMADEEAADWADAALDDIEHHLKIDRRQFGRRSSEESLVDQGFGPITPERAETAFASGRPEEILRALLRLSMHGPDWDLAERRALEFLSHPDAWVRRNAATSLGHISRAAGKLDVDVVVPALLALMADEEAAGWADDALDDIEHYLKIDRRRFIGRGKSADL